MDLESCLRKAGIWYRFIEKAETVHTADASKATGIELHRITKNLVCKTSDGDYALLIIAGDRKVNLQRAAQALKTRNVHLLSFSEAETVSGYPPGGTPSICHRTKMNVVLDEELLNFETIYCGGGSRGRLLELRTADILRLNSAVKAEMSE
jgi:Cys-tRNA(Pro)/Cys-tRNA(Cys) deacylase